VPRGLLAARPTPGANYAFDHLGIVLLDDHSVLFLVRSGFRRGVHRLLFWHSFPSAWITIPLGDHGVRINGIAHLTSTLPEVRSTGFSILRLYTDIGKVWATGRRKEAALRSCSTGLPPSIPKLGI